MEENYNNYILQTVPESEHGELKKKSKMLRVSEYDYAWFEILMIKYSLIIGKPLNRKEFFEIMIKVMIQDSLQRDKNKADQK